MLSSSDTATFNPVATAGRTGDRENISAVPAINLTNEQRFTDPIIAPLPPPEPVELTEDEHRSLRRWGVLAGDTPRRLKRFARSYVILRASLPSQRREAFMDGREYDAVARLLALNSAEPHRWPAYVTAITKAEPDARLDAEPDSPTAAQLQPWLDEISRFGFSERC